MARFLKRKVDTSSEFVDVDTLPSDPYNRKPIESYNGINEMRLEGHIY